MRKHQFTSYSAVLVLAATLTACGSGGDTDSQTDATPTPTSSNAPTPSETPSSKTAEEKATEQLIAYLDLRDNALRSAEIDLKLLNRVATGDAFLTVQQNVSAIGRSGSKIVGEYQHTLGEARDRGAHILIVDCEDSSQVEQTKDGQPVPAPVGPDGKPVPNPLPIEYKLVKQKGRWLVSEQNGLLEESC